VAFIQYGLDLCAGTDARRVVDRLVVRPEHLRPGRQRRGEQQKHRQGEPGNGRLQQRHIGLRHGPRMQTVLD
jgi:hypothetical protein